MGEPVPEAKVLVLALRKRLALTQEQLAARSNGRLSRLDVNKIETGSNLATTDRVRAGLAEALRMNRDQIASFLDGSMSLERAVVIAGDVPAPAAAVPPSAA